MRKNKFSSRQREQQSKTTQLPVLVHPYEDVGYDFSSGYQRYGREKLRAAYAVRNFRMFAPFLTQLSTQYDPMDAISAERRERRKQAKISYESNGGKKRNTPFELKRHDLKV